MQNLLEDSVPARALIEDIAPMSVLRAEYENGSQSFVKQIDSLVAKGFDSIRRARGQFVINRSPFCRLFMKCTGDGDCFYRCDYALITYALLLLSLVTLQLSHLLMWTAYSRLLM